MALGDALAPSLEPETYTSHTAYDALNRPTQLIEPMSDEPGARRTVLQPVYSEARLLERLDVWLDVPTEPSGLLDTAVAPPSPVGVSNIDYDAKGQRTSITYANGVRTTYTYDPLTFRLAHLVTARPAAALSRRLPATAIARFARLPGPEPELHVRPGRQHHAAPATMPSRPSSSATGVWSPAPSTATTPCTG